ncbi:exported protein (PHISTa), partial [Plasmodium gaboni]
DLRNIWSHTVDIAKEGLDNLLKESKTSVQKYLDNNIHISHDKYGNQLFVYDEIWNEYISRFFKEVAIEEVEYTNTFFSLINDKHTLDDILKFIYSFLEYFEILKKILQEEYHEELLRTIVENLNEKK